MNETLPVKPARGRRRSGEPSGREALLRSALQSFSKYGYEGVSLRALASDAGVDMALVGRIFGSKANLWDAVVEHLAERQLHHLEQLRLLAVQVDSHPRDAIIGFIRLFADISYEMPEFPAFLIQEASNPGVRLTKLSVELVGPFSVSSKPIIAKAQAAGVIVAPNERLFFGMLTSAVSLPMVAPSVFCGKKKLTLKLKKQIAEQAIAMFVQALPA
ncbi:TetR/AcrR family transcriptional regulator [Pseudomonas syringae]|uniref:TetR family transcriptional regulator n=1 Tax=Pseudomonas syringae pv. papulans TaxID=83963 RepID=A0A0P9Y908_PSESX|nr:TetR family transcriptional regulator [Pseudomonas syringae]KPY30285.1 Uncharacterized protein ALO65_02422 [Pseudomonas syringae pv. papulans]KWS32811.1 hypothetical protein AL059_13180 [Pseudomonas syringae pv. papulans]MDH4606312.1 TetR family transcriptional regulator [Pseudomonas syringae pv. papulans]MDH4623141.1 TetR family transcriptional regulator [Pseudomonas syringae pv. papulans]RMN40255.1 hypothetical protein ALQ60_02401 [Pseudomonas syringae pv. papulans]